MYVVPLARYEGGSLGQRADVQTILKKNPKAVTFTVSIDAEVPGLKGGGIGDRLSFLAGPIDLEGVLQFGDKVAGYANYGRNRARSLFYEGEVYELYLRPEYQGLGFGRRLFNAARKDLQQSGLRSLVVWALSDNEPAVSFYRTLGGRAVARSSEKFGSKTLDKVAYAWQA